MHGGGSPARTRRVRSVRARSHRSRLLFLFFGLRGEEHTDDPGRSVSVPEERHRGRVVLHLSCGHGHRNVAVSANRSTRPGISAHVGLVAGFVAVDRLLHGDVCVLSAVGQHAPGRRPAPVGKRASIRLPGCLGFGRDLGNLLWRRLRRSTLGRRGRDVLACRRRDCGGRRPLGIPTPRAEVLCARRRLRRGQELSGVRRRGDGGGVWDFLPGGDRRPGRGGGDRGLPADGRVPRQAGADRQLGSQRQGRRTAQRGTGSEDSPPVVAVDLPVWSARESAAFAIRPPIHPADAGQGF